MNEKTGIEVHVEILRETVEEHGRRLGFVERGVWWLMGAVAGIAGLAGAIMSGVLKKIVS
jgi:hypothetical protein